MCRLVNKGQATSAIGEITTSWPLLKGECEGKFKTSPFSQSF